MYGGPTGLSALRQRRRIAGTGAESSRRKTQRSQGHQAIGQGLAGRLSAGVTRGPSSLGLRILHEAPVDEFMAVARSHRFGNVRLREFLKFEADFTVRLHGPDQRSIYVH